MNFSTIKITENLIKTHGINDKEYKVIKFLEHWMEYTAGGTHAPGGRTGTIKQNRSSYFIRMQYPEDYRMEETKIIKFERDYANSLEYTFFNLFPQNVTNIAVSYDQSKTLTASATFEYTRYVSGPISSISAYRSDAGFNNMTIEELKKQATFEYRERPVVEDIGGGDEVVVEAGTFDPGYINLDPITTAIPGDYDYRPGTIYGLEGV